MYEDHDDFAARPRAGRRPGELKSWLAGAVFALALGYGAAASLGDAVGAAQAFLSGPDHARGGRAFGDGLFDSRTAIPSGTPALVAAAGIPTTIGPRDTFPSAALLAPSSEEAGRLAPGSRLVLVGRVALSDGGR